MSRGEPPEAPVTRAPRPRLRAGEPTRTPAPATRARPPMPRLFAQRPSPEPLPTAPAPISRPASDGRPPTLPSPPEEGSQLLPPPVGEGWGGGPRRLEVPPRPWPEHHPHLAVSAESAPPRARSPWPAWAERPLRAPAPAMLPEPRPPHRPRPPIEPLEGDPADLWPTLPEPEPDAGWEAATVERRLSRARALRAEQRGEA